MYHGTQEIINHLDKKNIMYMEYEYIIYYTFFYEILVFDHIQTFKYE